MLPWLIAVLLVLNLCLFWWGQNHEVPIDPKLPPLPAAAYRIELLDPADEADAMIAPAPHPASATMVSIPEQGATQSEGLPPDPQSPSGSATAEATPSAAMDAGNAPVAAQTVDGTAPPVAAEGVLATPDVTPGAEALLPTAIAAGAAGGAVAGSAVPKVAKKRKVKRRKAAKPVEPFHDF